VNAFLAGKQDVSSLYERAVQLALTVETNFNSLRRKRGPDDVAQQLGDTAGLRLAEAAARALAAGNRPLCQCWLHAAQATDKLVEIVVPKGRSTAELKLTLTAAHGETAVQTADELEAQAVAMQSGESTQAVTIRTEDVAQPACA
jgi:hypothetical protein